MRRILVIGPTGAGKSTFAQQLGAILRLPVIHLDREYWQPGWVRPPSAQWESLQAEMVAGDGWILDGNYGGSLPVRLQRADTVFFLDLHPLRCFARVLRRAVRYHGRVRPDSAPGCPERWPTPDFLGWILTYRRRHRPKVEQQLASQGRRLCVERLRSPRQVRRALQRIEREHAVAAAAIAAAVQEATRFAER